MLCKLRAIFGDPWKSKTVEEPSQLFSSAKRGKAVGSNHACATPGDRDAVEMFNVEMSRFC